MLNFHAIWFWKNVKFCWYNLCCICFMENCLWLTNLKNVFQKWNILHAFCNCVYLPCLSCSLACLPFSPYIIIGLIPNGCNLVQYFLSVFSLFCTTQHWFDKKVQKKRFSIIDKTSPNINDCNNWKKYKRKCHNRVAIF